MTLTMCKLSVIAKQHATRDERAMRARTQAVEFIWRTHYFAEAVRRTGVTRSTCDRLKASLKATDETGLKTLLELAQNLAGRRPVITAEEEYIINKRMRWAATRCFAWRYEDMKSTMALTRLGLGTDSIASCDDAVRGVAFSEL